MPSADHGVAALGAFGAIERDVERRHRNGCAYKVRGKAYLALQALIVADMLKRDMEPLPQQKLALQRVGFTDLPRRRFRAQRTCCVEQDCEKNSLEKIWPAPCIRIFVVQVEAELVIHNAVTSQHS